MRWDLFLPPVRLLAPWPDLERMLVTEEERAEDEAWRARDAKHQRRHPPRQMSDEEIGGMVEEARSIIRRNLRAREARERGER